MSFAKYNDKQRYACIKFSHRLLFLSGNETNGFVIVKILRFVAETTLMIAREFPARIVLFSENIVLKCYASGGNEQNFFVLFT